MKFEEVYAINVNDRTEKKGNLTYLSWAWAWAEFKKAYPDATYSIWRDDGGLPYVHDPGTGYMVYTSVTAGGITHEMWLPVMDGANNAMKAEPYKIKKFSKETTVEAATMFDINKAIMRCLTKNLAMFGLGLYIYAGEDLPDTEKKPAGETTLNPEQRAAVLRELTRTGISKASTAQAFGVSDIADIPVSKYADLMNQLAAKPDRA